MSDPRETEHIECDCVPNLGPSHCHLCGERLGHPVTWIEAHPDESQFAGDGSQMTPEELLYAIFGEQPLESS